MPGGEEAPSCWCPGCRSALPAGQRCEACGRHGVRRAHLGDPDPLLGALFAERWWLVARLGRGGFGGVYLGLERGSLDEVAVKVLRSDRTRPQDIARFRREAQALALLDHPNIVTFQTSGELPGDSGTLHYYVMESFDGAPTLADRLRDGGFADDAACWRFLDGALSGLEAAHDADVLHRDLKPANLLVVDGEARIVDFGLARSVATLGPLDAVTEEDERAFRGTAAYAAPEQLSGGRVGPACDVYAMGCVLYELWTGRRAWPGGTRAILEARRTRPAQPFAEDAFARLEPERQAVLLDAMSLRPERRLPSAAALREALAELFEPDSAPSVTVELPRPVDRSSTSPEPSPERPRFGRWIALLLGLLLLSALIVAVVSRPEARPKAAADAPKRGEAEAGPVEVPRPPEPGEAPRGLSGTLVEGVVDGASRGAIVGGTRRGGLRPVALEAGSMGTLARMSDGSVWAWGHHALVGRTREEGGVTTPVMIPKVADASVMSMPERGTTACALTRSGVLWCWGASRATPGPEPAPEPRPRPVLPAQALRDVALHAHMGVVVTRSGAVLSWSSAASLPKVIALPEPVTQVAMSHGYLCALLASGTLHCGAIKDPSLLSLERIEGAPRALRIEMGSRWTCALWSEDGRTLSCWERMNPGMGRMFADVESFDVGLSHLCYTTRAAGEVWCVGDNARGQLGVVGVDRALTPVRVEGLEGVVELALGDTHSCAMRADASVWCWGGNRLGQLGDGTLIDRSEPVRVTHLGRTFGPATAAGRRSVPVRIGDER